VHVDHRVEVLVGHLPQDPVPQDARVRDHHVQPAELLDRRGDQPLGDLGRADRGDDGRGPAPLRDDRVDDFRRRVAVQVVHDDRCPGRRQRLGVRAPEATARARDDGHLA
jgi:hypothetical protein